MAQQGGNQDQGTEMWGVVIIILAVLLYFALSQIFWIYVTGWKWLRIVEIGFLAFIVPDFIQSMMNSSFNEGLSFLLTLEPNLMTGEMVSEFDSLYVKYFNWIPALYLMYKGFKLFMKSEEVTTKYTMESLLIKMSHAFPHNKQFIGVNPEEMSLDFYPDDPSTYEYSLGMSERQFAQIVPPLGLEIQAEKNKSLKRPIWDGDKAFDDKLARMAMEAQLGPIYRGYSNLNEDHKKLTDLFINKLLIKQKHVLPLLRSYSEQIFNQRQAYFKKNKSNPNATTALPELKIKYENKFDSHVAMVEKLIVYVDAGMASNGPKWHPKDVDLRAMIRDVEMKVILRQVVADKLIHGHAYVFTGLMTLLREAREGATLAPSTLRWLKTAKNRTLWFALNAVGKKVSCSESSGPFAQWLLEIEVKMAVPYPEVTEAIEALRLALGLKSSFAQESASDWG